MKPEDALDQLHGHLAEWKRNRAEPTDDDINSVGDEPQTTVPEGSADPDLPPDINAQNLAESLKRGRALANPMLAKTAEHLGRGGARGAGDVPPEPDAPMSAPIAGGSPRSAMLSAVMGARKTPAAQPAATPGAVDAGMADAQGRDADAARLNRVGRAVTAMGELPNNEGRAIQGLSRAGVTMQAPAHSTLWDNKDGEGNAAALVAQRTASERKDPNSATAKTYREVLKRFSPDLNLDTANAEQMEKIAPWLEKYATENAGILKSKAAAEAKAAEDAKKEERHATERGEDLANRKETHADAQANAAAMRDLAAKRMDVEQSAKDQAGAQHLAGKAGETSAANAALDEIDASIAKSGGATPGVGRLKSMLPDALQPIVLSDEGMRNRNNAKDALSIVLHKRSGAAVSPAELSRYEQMYGLNGNEAQFAEGIKRLRRDFASELQAEQAGVSPGAKQKFVEGGGKLVTPAIPKASPGAGYKRGSVNGHPGWVNEEAGEWEPD